MKKQVLNKIEKQVKKGAFKIEMKAEEETNKHIINILKSVLNINKQINELMLNNLDTSIKEYDNVYTNILNQINRCEIALNNIDLCKEGYIQHVWNTMEYTYGAQFNTWCIGVREAFCHTEAMEVEGCFIEKAKEDEEKKECENVEDSGEN